MNENQQITQIFLCALCAFALIFFTGDFMSRHTTTNKNGTQIYLIYLIRVIRQISVLFTRKNDTP